MAQMYKVFNNSQKIVIDKSDTPLDFGDAAVICIRDLSRLPEIVESHVFTDSGRDLVLLSAEPQNLVKAFEDIFIKRITGGGWVFDRKNRLLMIKRNGFWDFPKGHIDKGETLEECALREVEEETGVNGLSLVKPLGISRHIFVDGKKRVLKENHWFQVKTAFDGDLKPQKKEGITKVKWVKPSKIREKLDKGWLSVREFYDDFVKPVI